MVDPSPGFTDKVLSWYQKNGREFYWRTHELSSFELLVTELLLKRTLAETVDNRMPGILESLSSPQQVLQMDQKELESVLEPFGLYRRRSENLQKVCHTLIEKHDGQVPDSRAKLIEIEGIGEYAADAILAFCYLKPVLVLDTNTARVAEFYFEIEPPSDLREDEEIRSTLEPLVPEGNPAEFNWGLLDLGAELRGGKDPFCS